MVTICPAEDNPKNNVKEFVGNDSVRFLAGLREDGIKPLMDLVKKELAEQYPDSEILVIDRDTIADNGIDFVRELEQFVRSKITSGKSTNILIYGDLSINEWQNAFAFVANEKITGIQVYFSSEACRRVPVCYKLP